MDTEEADTTKAKEVKEGGQEKVREGLVSVSCFFFGWLAV